MRLLSDFSYDPASHYDRVTDAWSLLLGEELHYGVFTQGDESLPDATRALTAAMESAAQLAPGMDVLDVGCGTGAPACHLARSAGARVVGITTSEVGVDQATLRAESMDLGDRVQFKVADGMDNGFPDASFDRVWVLESSHLMRHRDRLIAECARVLRAGGRMVLCDLMLRRPMPFDEVKRLRKPLAVLRDAFGDAHMQQMSQYTELAAANGLTVDTEVDLTAATRPTFDRWRANAAEHREAVVAALGEAGHTAFLESCDILEGFWDDGTMGYGLLAAFRP